MNSHDSLIVATQIADAKDQIIEAIKASKSYTLKDAAPMIGALLVAFVSAGIAIWSLKRNTNYDREKRIDDRKKETLHIIRKIYGELVSLNSQLLTGLDSLNQDKLSYEYYMELSERATTASDHNTEEFYKHLNNFKESAKELKVVLHKYLSLLSEYRFLTDSKQILLPIAYLNKLVLKVKFEENFNSVADDKLIEMFNKLAGEAHQINMKKTEELSTQINHIFLTEKENYN